MHLNKILSIVVLLLFVNGTYLLFNKIQPQMQHNAGLGFDGVSYYKMYRYFKVGGLNSHRLTPDQNKYNADDSLDLLPELNFRRLMPYHNRVLIPFLAALIPVDNPVNAFKIISVVFINLFTLLMYFVWKAVGIPIHLMVAGFLWFFFHWLGPNRFFVYYPVLVDLPTYFFQTLLLWMIIKDNFKFLPLISSVAVLQKESFFILVFFLLLSKIIELVLFKNSFVATNVGKQKIKSTVGFIILSLGIMIATKYLSNQFIVQGAGTTESVIIWQWVKLRFTDPYSLSKLLAAIFVGFGAFPILLIYHFKKLEKNSLNMSLVLFSASFCLSGFFAGSDITRIIFLGFPSIMTLCLISIKDLGKSKIAIILFLCLPVLRLFEVIPEPDLANSENAFVGYYSWFPDYAHLSVNNFWLIYAVILYLITGNILKTNTSPTISIKSLA